MRRPPRAATGRGGGQRWSPVRAAALFVVVLLAVAGSGFLLAGLTAQPPRPPRPPQPAANAAPPPDFDPIGQDPAGEPATGPISMERSVPVRIEIPEIDVSAKIMKLGVDDDNEVEVPPLKKARLAGWYRYGASPGEVGNAVIIGHVDSYEIGPAVFFYLGDLEPGDPIRVIREDGTVAEFVVDGLESYPKDEFPHDLVYGPADAAQLRVVTCGGTFDKKRREYPDNLVVFASLR
jgi:sortase (surface protein transpeptidase)